MLQGCCSAPSTMAGASVKLSYFNIEGLAEKVRLTLAVTGTPFEDFRFSFEDWPNVKPTTPFGQVPLLEVTLEDGSKKAFAQSNAMMRYVARKFDKTGTLYPADAEQSVVVEEMVGLVDDLTKTWNPCKYLNMGQHTNYGHPAEWAGKDDTVRALREKFVAEGLPRFMGYFTAKLESTGAFLCGANVTIADLMLLAQLRYFASGTADNVPKDCLDAYPQVTAWMGRMYAIPEIKAKYGL